MDKSRMAIKDTYPRVLMVLMTKVKAEDPGNLLIRAQFSDWPKDSLAQIHAAGESAGHGEFCGCYYSLDVCDRVFGGLFRRLRSGVFAMVAMDAVEGQASVRTAGRLGRWARVTKKCLGDWLIGSGLWELIFRVHLSESMVRFVEDFKPDLVYCQGYSLGFATLPILIARRFCVPICFQTTDDWPNYTYQGFLMGWLLRHRARQLVTEAKVRMAFGKKMQRLYENRYGVRFETTYHLDDPRRFLVDSGVVLKPFQIIYTGSLGLRRYEAIQDMLDVIRTLQDRIRPIQILLYCSGLPKDIPRDLLDAPEVKVLPLPTHDELPRILASASVLFLPESFNVIPEQIEYAISSKAHLYMMSGRPILVYGPAYSGTVEYAIESGWAVVVKERTRTALENALWRLIDNSVMAADLRQKALACVKNNHDLMTGRERFSKLLINCSVLHSENKSDPNSTGFRD